MIPKKFILSFVADYPALAAMICALGFILVGFVMGILFTDRLGR